MPFNGFYLLKLVNSLKLVHVDPIPVDLNPVDLNPVEPIPVLRIGRSYSSRSYSGFPFDCTGLRVVLVGTGIIIVG